MVVEVGGLDMVKQQLEAVSGQQHKKLKSAYLEQLEKATGKLKDMQKAKVAGFLAFPGKPSGRHFVGDSDPGLEGVA